MSTIRKHLFDRLDRARIASFQRRELNRELHHRRAAEHVAIAAQGGRIHI